MSRGKVFLSHDKWTVFECELGVCPLKRLGWGWGCIMKWVGLQWGCVIKRVGVGCIMKGWGWAVLCRSGGGGVVHGRRSLSMGGGGGPVHGGVGVGSYTGVVWGWVMKKWGWGLSMQGWGVVWCVHEGVGWGCGHAGVGVGVCP